MRKFGCLVVMLLATQGAVFGMMHTKRIVNGASRLQLHGRALCGKESKAGSSSLMDATDRYYIRQAYISSIYKVAQIEATCKVHANSDLNPEQKKAILHIIPYIVKE